jgi:fatty acid desaturase
MGVPAGYLTDSISARRYRGKEIQAARAWLAANGVVLEDFERKSLGLYVAAVSAVWIGVAAAVELCRAAGPSAAFASIVLIGYLQRALGNLLHDFAHGGFPARRCANLSAALLAALPLLVTLRQYRANHFAHHKYLGEPSLDPDFIHDPESLRKGSWHALATCLTSRNIWLGSFLGQLAKPCGTPKLAIVLWWLIVPAAVWIAFDDATALAFIGLWFIARATSFHVITTFREFADHVGLVPGGIVSFTRNSPSDGLLRHIAHPYENGLHLAHHLFPRVPFYRLGRMHRTLLAWPYYASAENCPSYFGGRARPGTAPSVYNSLSIHVRSSAEMPPPAMTTL